LRRRALAILVALASAAAAAGLDVAPVLAECPYLPPWPPITTAIATARGIVVGEVVTAFDPADLHAEPGGGVPDYALRVTHVLRGDAEVGDLLDVQYLLPNWPQTKIAGEGGTLASCTSLPVAPGEVIALAFDAMQRGGPMRDGDVEWVQPPTRYNALGVIKWNAPGQEDNEIWQERQRVSLSQLRSLASIPQTDAAHVTVVWNRSAVLLAAGLAALLIGLRRFRARRGCRPIR